MAKQITYSDHSRQAIPRDGNQVGAVVKVTSSQRGGPAIAKNGVTAAKEIESRNPRENIDAQLRRDRQRDPAARAKPMKHINFPVTVEELRLLASLASDQLFRRQFIDPRMPGYKGSPEDVALGKVLVGRMRLIIDETQHITSAMTPSRPSKERRIL